MTTTEVRNRIASEARLLHRASQRARKEGKTIASHSGALYLKTQCRALFNLGRYVFPKEVN